MLLSFAPIALLVLLLFSAVQLFGADASYGPNQVALLIATACAGLVGMYRGMSWADVQDSMVDGIKVGLAPILILLAVGGLIGSWMIAGTVPAMIYYGVSILDPDIFFAAAAIICALASISIGSSWTVAGTLGIGLIGIADSYGLPPAMAAGAIISGAYFGDKLSRCRIQQIWPPPAPMLTSLLISDTCYGQPSPLFASPCSFIPLWTRVRPRLQSNCRATLSNSRRIQCQFGVLTPLVVMLLLIWRKVPAYPAIMLATVAGIITALTLQVPVVEKFALAANPDTTRPLVEGLWRTLFEGFQGTTDNESLNSLISKGGIASMLNTVWLIVSALAFGGVLERTGILKQILDAVLKAVKSTGDLVLATVTGGFVTNILAADQFLAIALPGRLFANTYDDFNLSRENLSRTLEDSATMTSALIPWNTCGAYMAATLGVATFDYAPYAIFNIVCPLIAIAFGYLLVKQKPAAVEPA